MAARSAMPSQHCTPCHEYRKADSRYQVAQGTCPAFPTRVWHFKFDELAALESASTASDCGLSGIRGSGELKFLASTRDKLEPHNSIL